MPYIVSKNFRLHCARQFLDQFIESTPTNMYMFVGKSTAWADEGNPDAINDDMQDIVFKVWNNALAMKQVVGSQAAISASRLNWTSGTVYTQYDDLTVYNNSAFYVLTSNFDCYKCLGNNNGATSTVQPTGTLTTPFTTSDGYLWKYMFTVSGPDSLSFLTTDFMPVHTLTTNDGSTQWAVQAAAIDGAIHQMVPTAGGTGYINNLGSIVTTTGTTAILASGASGTNNIYNGYAIYIASGTGAGQYRTISAYNGSTRTITISSAWSTNPDSTSTYVVSPLVTITGNGTGCVAYSNIVAGALSSVTIVNPGSGYRKATVVVSGSTGSGATLRAVMSPIGGHGKDAVSELFCSNVTINIKLTGSESGVFFVGNEYRMTGLLANPTLVSGGAIASGASYDLTTHLTITPGSGTFTNDELVTGGTSGAATNLVDYIDTTHLSLMGTVNNYTVGETITGGTSGATAVVTAVTPSLISTYSGLPIYVRTATAITRSTNQTENFRITTKF